MKLSGIIKQVNKSGIIYTVKNIRKCKNLEAVKNTVVSVGRMFSFSANLGIKRYNFKFNMIII